MSLPPADDGAGVRSKEARRVANATFLGTALEWYDFYLYALCAALVFGPLFFATEDPLTAQLGALATFAVGFVARPIGGVVAGHFGDKLGRKQMLVSTLLVMGGATVAVGLVPTHAQIGLAAPVLLVVLRIVQGLAMGGEWGGAVSMAIEHAPAHRRSFYASAIAIGPAVGLVLANLVLLGLMALTGEAFLQWGWRLAFLSSIILIGVGLWARRRISESPLFETAVAGEPEPVPVLEVLRSHGGTLLKTLMVAGIPGISSYMIYTYTLAYGSTTVGYSRSSLLWISIAVALMSIPLTAYCARLADRIGVWPVLALGCVLQAAAALVLFPLFDTGNLLLAILASIVVVAPACLGFGAIPAMLSDRFPTKVRYTGISLSYQLGSIVGGGLAPLIATAIYASSGTSWLIGAYMAGANVVALLCLLLLRTPRSRSGGGPDGTTDAGPRDPAGGPMDWRCQIGWPKLRSSWPWRKASSDEAFSRRSHASSATSPPEVDSRPRPEPRTAHPPRSSSGSSPG